MRQVVPALRITDYAKSKAFYVGGLGFQIPFEHRYEPHFPVFMEICRDGMSIYLTQHSGACQVGGMVHLYVPDVDAWYVELQSRGVPIKSPPSETIEGLRDMAVVDPDGNKLRIGSRLPRKNTIESRVRQVDLVPAMPGVVVPASIVRRAVRPCAGRLKSHPPSLPLMTTSCPFSKMTPQTGP